MSAPNKKLLKSITSLQLEMRDGVIAARVSAEEYDKPFNSVPEMSPEALGEFEGWLRGLRVGTYADMLRIYQERDPKYWTDLEAFGEENFPEQIILRSKRKLLREAWRKRNGQPKRKKPDPVPDAAQADPC